MLIEPSKRKCAQNKVYKISARHQSSTFYVTSNVGTRRQSDSYLGLHQVRAQHSINKLKFASVWPTGSHIPQVVFRQPSPSALLINEKFIFHTFWSLDIPQRFALVRYIKTKFSILTIIWLLGMFKTTYIRLQGVQQKPFVIKNTGWFEKRSLSLNNVISDEF